MSSLQVIDEADELWLRLGWYTWLRWMVPVPLLIGSRVWDAIIGRIGPALPGMIVVGGLLLLNGVYATLLRRWRSSPRDHAVGLASLAHVMVVLDLAGDAGGVMFSGGPESPFWPTYLLTMLAAALFFPRLSTLIAYGLLATVLELCVELSTGGTLHAPHVWLLAIMLAMQVAIASFYARRMQNAQEAMVELERLRSEKAAVEEVGRKKDEILSKVSHELRNPLAALRGWIDVARRRRFGSVAGQPMEKVLGRIDAQVDKMSRMVSDLYDLSSVRSGQLRLERRPCDLVAVVRELIDRFSAVYPDLQVTLEAPEAMWGSWDPARLDQLVTNLVGNAVKYAVGSPVLMRILPASGGAAHLQVIDEGPGIPPEKLGAIFEAFTRASGRASGLGLGLAIAREIVVGHGGAIWVDSQIGRGTTFHVRLPTGGVQPPS